LRLSEELARILPGRRGGRDRFRPADQAPREIVPSSDPSAQAKAQRLDAARARLREQIPPRSDETQ
jgi:hypothetical protein